MKPRLFILFLALLIAMSTSAADEWWGNINVRSRHFDTARHYNENNFGGGIEYVHDQAHSVVAGRYRNSEYCNSDYLSYGYTPFEWQGLRAGVMLGLVNGYPKANHGNFIPMGGLLLKMEWKQIGANLYLTPECHACNAPAAIALQLRLRFR